MISPLVIVNKKDGGIRMIVDYREVNMRLEITANQLPYQPTFLLQCLSEQNVFAKVDNLLGYHQIAVKSLQSSRLGVFIAFSHVHLVYQLRQGVSSKNGPRNFKSFF